MTKNTIDFGDKQATAYTISPAATPQELGTTVQLPSFETVLLLFGGADQLDAAKSGQVKSLLQEGLLAAAIEHQAVIIDGGTHSGVMQLLGDASAQEDHPVPLIGIVPEKLVSYPGKTGENLVPLDENHGYFLLVAGAGEWGGETRTMFKLAEGLSNGNKKKPVVAVLIGGGEITAKEALSAAREGITLIVIKGSGGFADKLSDAWEKRATPPADAGLLEILKNGELIFHELTAEPDLLAKVINRRLAIDAVLSRAWYQFARFDLNAGIQQDKHKSYQKMLIRLGIAVAAVAILYKVLFTAAKPAEFDPCQWFVYAISVALPVVLTVVTVAANNFKNGKKWIFFRAAAENLKREIFAYRTRTGAYRESPGPLLAQRVSEILTKAMSTEINSAYIEPYDTSKGYPPDMYGQENPDDGFSKLDPDNYIRIRLTSQISYYEKKVGDLRKDLDKLHWATYILGGASTLLAVFGQQIWIPLATTITTAIGAWLGQMQWENTLSTYNQNAASLNDILFWWDALSPTEQQQAVNKDDLVLRTETTLKNEYDGWVQQMKQSLDKLDKKNEPSNSNKP